MLGLLLWRSTSGKPSSSLSDELNGKTALLKALLNLRDGRNDTVEVLLHVAARTGDLTDLINASYKDPLYKGGAQSRDETADEMVRSDS